MTVDTAAHTVLTHLIQSETAGFSRKNGRRLIDRNLAGKLWPPPARLSANPASRLRPDFHISGLCSFNNSPFYDKTYGCFRCLFVDVRLRLIPLRYKLKKVCSSIKKMNSDIKIFALPITDHCDSTIQICTLHKLLFNLGLLTVYECFINGFMFTQLNF